MFTQEQITAFLMKCVWVGCGFVGGYVFTMLAGMGFDKLVTKRPSPAFLHTWARRVGGLIVAIIVAFFVFPGGTGNGFGGGNGTGQQGGDTAGPTTPTSSKPTPEPDPVVLSADAVGVTIYAGNAVEKGTENFFAVGTGKQMVDAAEVMKEVRRRREKSPGMVIVYTFDATATKLTPGFDPLKAAAEAENVPLLTPAEYQKLRKAK